MRLGRYQVTRQLATGALGERLLASDGDAAVAIRRIRDDLSRDPELAARFLREAGRATELRHDNIARVLDFGVAGGRLFIASEHVSGPDLAQTIEAATGSGAAIPPPLVAHIGVAVCRALDCAHGLDAPIVHGDLSPRTILLSFNGGVKVIDYGLGARETPYHATPEQSRGEPLEPRSDLFAVGMALREALEGSEVPRAMARILEVATRPELDRRCASAAQMQEALEHYLAGARSPKADPPERELGAWLRELIPRSETAGRPIDGPDVEAITVAEHGLEALETAIAGTAAAAPAAAPPAAPPAAADPGPRPAPITGPPAPPFEPVEKGRRWLALPFASLAVVVIWLLIARATRSEPAPGPEPTRAYHAVIDAAPIDAAPVADAPEPGTVVVESPRPTEVRVGGRVLCTDTPCSRELAPGRHVLELIDRSSGSRIRREVVVLSGRTHYVVVPH